MDFSVAQSIASELASDIIDFYGYECEATIAFHMLASDLQRMHSDPSFDGQVAFHRSFGDDPIFGGSAYKNTTERLLKRVGPNGSNTRRRHHSIIAFLVSRWEQHHRGRFASIAAISENDVKSDIFRDLNRYRNSIMHTHGIFSDKPYALPFFNKGDDINFSNQPIDILFQFLIDETNALSWKYLGIKTQFSLTEPADAWPVFLRSNTHVQYPPNDENIS